MNKVVLISQFPMPYHNIGSWTTLYKNYLSQPDHKIDYIICEEPVEKFTSATYIFVQNNLQSKLQKKWTKNPYTAYLKALDNLIKTGEHFVIQLVDNFGLAKSLSNYLQKNKLRERCYIQFFYHGFAPFYGNFQSRWFYEFIDEMVLLTHDSYRAHKDYYTILPCRFSVMHNGINTDKFYPVSVSEKVVLKEKMGAEGKTVFVWCSQDRPKKGLDFILSVWQKIIDRRQDIELWVIGATREKTFAQVRFFGKIPNEDLPSYFQTADCYLFPTLCHEGFGMSLIEALHCGCYPIASALGGVPEVLAYGKYGKLIENPHFDSEWEAAIRAFLQKNYAAESLPKALYSSNQWNERMNFLVENALRLI